MAKRLFTSESVTEGHPDKVCDQISDAVLDDILAHDPTGRVACETFASTGLVTVMGEITTSCYVDIPSSSAAGGPRIGYTDPAYGFDCRSCAVITTIDEQSADIAMGVDKSYENQGGRRRRELDNGAGDQGMMFGYACDETPELMPSAHLLWPTRWPRQLTDVRKSGKPPRLSASRRQDAGHRGVRRRRQALPPRHRGVSTQHDPDVALEQIRKDMIEHGHQAHHSRGVLDENTKFYVNPTGRFVIGGPQGDTGLTGRKIIVDTYGGSAPHGGGCFSGKDPTKVDRSAAYAAR